MDRISQLPDFVVHHILSFINSPAELVRLSVLSRFWFNLTASFPILDFYNSDFGSRDNFFKYVEYTTSRFCHQNITAYRLVLSATLQKPAELDIVNRCLQLLLQKGVRELEIDLLDYTAFPSVANYRLPDVLLSVSVLESLTIRGCYLPSSFKFKSLIQLRLSNLQIDDEVIGNVTTSCPLLQEFQVLSCHGFKKFCVYGHQWLKHVWINHNTPVELIEVEAPNLTNLEVTNMAGRGPPRMNLASCRKLTSVYYNGYPLQNTNGFTDFLSSFPFIENLVLVTRSIGKNLKLSVDSLRTLVLRSDCDLEEIELSTPNLGLFVYSCNAWYPWAGMGLLPHLKSCMLCYPNGSIDALWFQKLRRFLGKDNGFKALNLYIHTNRKFVVLKNLKMTELPPHELKHVELHFEHEESSNRSAFVDAVLWCCRPRSLTLRSSFPLPDFEEQSDLVKFTYKKLLQQEDQGHSNIKIISPYSSKAQKQFRGLMLLPGPSSREEKAICFIKE